MTKSRALETKRHKEATMERSNPTLDLEDLRLHLSIANKWWNDCMKYCARKIKNIFKKYDK